MSTDALNGTPPAVVINAAQVEDRVRDFLTGARLELSKRGIAELNKPMPDWNLLHRLALGLKDSGDALSQTFGLRVGQQSILDAEKRVVEVASDRILKFPGLDS